MNKLFAFLGSAILAVSANAVALQLEIDDPFYLGQIVDGIPANPNAEVGYINTLIPLPPGGPQTVGTEDYYRSDLAGEGLAELTDADKAENGDPIDVTDYAYILGKYDADLAGSYVWAIDGLTGMVQLPETVPGTDGNPKGISHTSRYAGFFIPDEPEDPPTVPDGGTTLLLAGLGMVALGFFGRKRSR